jgi:hypothetical protein
MPEQIRTDLALLEGRQMNAVNTARQQPCQVGLAHRQRQLPKREPSTPKLSTPRRSRQAVCSEN